MSGILVQVEPACCFLLSPGVANMAPIFAAHLFPKHRMPLDFGLYLGPHRVLGDHKTFRGLIAGILGGGVTFLLQREFAHLVGATQGFCYHEFNGLPLWFGFWLGFCAIAGDALKSFCKRRLNIAPGESWIPFDQLDWMVGALIGTIPFFSISFWFTVITLLLAAVFSFCARVIGYFLSLNSKLL